MAKIIYDEEMCIGCRECARVCPQNWKMVKNKDGEIKAKPKTLVTDDVEGNQEAAAVCPVSCIDIVED